MDKQTLLKEASKQYSEDEVLDIRLSVEMATEAHKGQKRRSGEKYISHPLAVATTLVEWGMDSDSIIAGILHDTVEDTSLSLDTIENNFGGDVAFLVDGVTKVGQARAGMHDISEYSSKTRDNLSKLLIAVGQDVRVIIIKLADRLHNLETLDAMPREKQIKIARESLEVFAPVADRLGMGRLRVRIEELAFSYLEPKEYKKLKKLMKQRLGKSHRKLQVAQKEVEKILHDQKIDFQIDGRVKSIYSLYKKLQKVGGNIDDIYDLIALRIIVSSSEDCYRVLGILHQLYQPMLARIKDYIASPKPNGYQSLHTTVITPKEQIIEFQIRSQAMHEYAERGLAASFHYHEQKSTKNYHKNISQKLPSDLQWITQLQEVAGKLRDGEEISHNQLAIDLFRDRIFVYSPKGDIYNLPEGALPLDFAYLVHSDVGRRTIGCKVNSKIHTLDKPLQNGDVVEIITRRNAHPKKDWLKLVKTTHARNKLRAQLKKIGAIESLTQAVAIIRDKALRKNKTG
jgi:GTP pyrophosphokinase